jgi:hypothetical protein
MSNISYSIVCEDIAHACFVKLLMASSIGGLFEFDEPCYRRFICSTKKQVVNGYANIAAKAFREYPIGLLIVMVDIDDEDIAHQDYHKQRQEELWSMLVDKIVIAIPVQSIEHWLRLMQWLRKNPTATRNVSFEREKRSESKMGIYQTKKPSAEKTQKVITDLFDTTSLKRMEQYSPSFLHFMSQLRQKYPNQFR